MKLLITLLFLFLCKAPLFAQKDSLPLYQQFPFIPPFSVFNIADSSICTKANLLKRKPTLIILFSPDCDHCKQFISQLISNILLFTKYQILMVSFLDNSLIKKFYNDFELLKYKNITVVKDSSYYFGTFYALHTYPTIVVYNKKGKLVHLYEGTVSIHTITADL
jgi:Thioredoxin-like domain